MEYFLNCCWLLLFVPALWVWRRHTLSISNKHYRSTTCLVALVCAVFLLFPVISASDDLHAMRAEMEECGSGKRAFRQAPEQRTSMLFHSPPLATRLTPTFVFWFPNQISRRSTDPHLVVPVSASFSLLSSRAPPAPLLLGL